MSAFIYATVLFFGCAFGELKFRCNKLQRWRFGAFENNVFAKPFTRNGPNISGTSSSESDAESTKGKNASRREFAEGKSKSMNQIVIPLFLGVNMAGVFLHGLIAVKYFLLKGIFAGKVALIILGVILGRKIGTLLHLKNRHFYSENSFGQYPINEPDLSGYGYEYQYAPGFRTPEEKYASLIGKEINENRLKFKK